MPAKCKKSSRRSIEDMENKINTLSNVLFGLQEMVKGKSFGDKRGKNNKAGKQGPVESSDISQSVTTIYHNALEPLQIADGQQVVIDPEISFKKGDSSSSEDRVDTSDEFMVVDVDENKNGNEYEHREFVVEGFIQTNERRHSCSGDRGVPHQEQSPQRTAKQLADDMIRDAKASRARILNTPGK